MTSRAPARPVLKWAGGKTQILSEILELLPESIGTYFEPFAGGAAVFFALAAQGRFKRAVLADRNPDLLAVYRALQTDPEGVVGELEGMHHSEDEYSRVIYLNKTGYNGLYRVNRSGQFNVPFGRHKNPNFCDADNLRAAGEALAQVEIVEADFEEVCRRARRGDAVYLDPPYVPLSRTANFTAYARHPFGPSEHERLSQSFAALERRGVRAVLSNSDTPATRALYRGFRAKKVKVARNINSRSTARGPVDELLVVAERVTRPRSRAS